MALFRRGMHFGSYGSTDDGSEVFDRVCKAVVAAEDSGFDALSVPDHVLQNDVAGKARFFACLSPRMSAPIRTFSGSSGTLLLTTGVPCRLGAS